MAEIEDQLARLAEHRAAQIEPFSYLPSADELTRRRARRPTRLVVAVAACVAIALVVGGWMLFSASGDSPSVHSPAGPSPTVSPSTPPPSTVPSSTATTSVAPAPCPSLDGADLVTKHQPTGAVSGAVLADVQAGATDCTDVVTFFVDSMPAFTAGYEPGPFTLDPSGRPTTVDGNAFLVVRFEHTSGPDLASRDIHPAAGVREVRELQDFEGVTTWVIGLDQERPFRIVPGAGSFAIEFAANPGS